MNYFLLTFNNFNRNLELCCQIIFNMTKLKRIEIVIKSLISKEKKGNIQYIYLITV